MDNELDCSYNEWNTPNNADNCFFTTITLKQVESIMDLSEVDYVSLVCEKTKTYVRKQNYKSHILWLETGADGNNPHLHLFGEHNENPIGGPVKNISRNLKTNVLEKVFPEYSVKYKTYYGTKKANDILTYKVSHYKGKQNDKNIITLLGTYINKENNNTIIDVKNLETSIYEKIAKNLNVSHTKNTQFVSKSNSIELITKYAKTKELCLEDMYDYARVCGYMSKDGYKFSDSLKHKNIASQILSNVKSDHSYFMRYVLDNMGYSQKQEYKNSKELDKDNAFY